MSFYPYICLYLKWIKILYFCLWTRISLQ